MDHLPVNDRGNLLIAGIDATELAAAYGTPLFVYDVDQIKRNVENYRQAFEHHRVPRLVTADAAFNKSKRNQSRPRYQIAYASKALCITAIYEVLKCERNVSIDVVSGGELYTALRAGVDPRLVHFHGNNKSEAEIRFALEAGIGCFVVDSFHEIELLHRLTRGLFSSSSQLRSPPGGRRGRKVDVLLRVSPGVAAHTHEYISTGQTDSKFGFDVMSGQAQLAYERVTGRRLHVDHKKNNTEEAEEEGEGESHLRVVGLHCHIGSQIFSTEGYVLACRRLLQLAADWGILLTETTDGTKPARQGDSDATNTNTNTNTNDDDDDDDHDGAEGEEEEDGDHGDDDDDDDDGNGRRFVLNVGGGYGISYCAEDAPLPSAAFVDAILAATEAFLSEKAASMGAGSYVFPELWIEPGRSLVGAAGSTLYTVGARKTIPGLDKHFIAVDGGMSDNIRPALYQAKYTAYVVNRMPEHRRFAQLTPEEQAAELKRNTATQNGDGDAIDRQGSPRVTGMQICTVVGKLCETGDQLIKDAPFPCATQAGDVMAVRCTGAYGYSMASNYNRVCRPAVVFVESAGSSAGPQAQIVVKRESYEELVRNDLFLRSPSDGS